MGNNSLHCRECYNICIYHVHAANVHYINHRSNCPVFFIEYCSPAYVFQWTWMKGTYSLRMC